MLTICYNQLIRYTDSLYNVELKKAGIGSVRTSKSFVKQLQQQKKAIIKSQKEFERFRETTVEIIDLQYAGGSMRPMMDNIYRLDLTVSQIWIVLNMIDEIIGYTE